MMQRLDYQTATATWGDLAGCLEGYPVAKKTVAIVDPEPIPEPVQH